MSKVQWLGDPVSDCKADQLKVTACGTWAAGVTATVGQPFLTILYRDFCLHTLCLTGKMPKSEDVPPNLPPPPPLYEPFPYGVYDPGTVVLQKELNVLLEGNGYCKLNPDGKVDARTCGAAAKFGVPLPSCAGKPSTAPAPCGATPPSPAPPTPPAAATTTPPKSDVPWGTILVGGVVVAAVAYFYSQSPSSLGLARENPARGPSRMAKPDAQGRHPKYKHLVMFEIEPHYGSYILTATGHEGDALISEDDARQMFGKDFDAGFGYLTDEYLQILEKR